MSNIYNLIIGLIGKGTKEKERVVAQYCEVTRELFRLMLCPSILYNIKKIPNQPDYNRPRDINTDAKFILCIEQLISQDLRGIALNCFIDTIYQRCTSELREVLSWVLARKNPAKISKSIVNKAWPGLVRTQDYMGALPGKPNAITRLFNEAESVNGQIKEDGCCLLVDYERGCPTIGRTRQGNDIGKYFPEFMSSLNCVHIISDDERDMALDIRGFNGMVHHELFCSGMDRSTGNGLINKQVKNGWIGGNVDNYLHSVLLDYRDNDDPDVHQNIRHENLVYFVSGNTGRVLQRKLKTHKEAREWAKEVIRDGGEGLVLKDSAGLFKNGKHWNNLKIKNEFPVDLVVTDWKPHSKKPELIGSLLCESSDGKLKVWVNAKTEEDREFPFGLYWEGAIVKVLCESVTASKSRVWASLYLPRFDGKNYSEYVHLNKGKADTYREVLDQEAMSKGLKI